MAWKKPSDAVVKKFEAALPDDPRVVRKPMFGMPAAFVKGSLFAGTFEDAIVLRFSEEDAQAFAKLGATPFMPMPGKPMKNWAVAPKKILDDAAALRKWTKKAFDFAAALPPKKKKAPGAKKRR